jgi:hypothetical protein
MDGRERRSRDGGWAGRAGLLVLVMAAAGMARAVARVTEGQREGPHLLSFVPPCLFHRLTGLYCPGCGSARAIDHLARGEPVAAMGSNPLLVVALPLLVLAVLPPWVAGSRHAELQRIVRSPVIGWGFAVVTVLFAVLRNLPFGPFRWLAP